MTKKVAKKKVVKKTVAKKAPAFTFTGDPNGPDQGGGYDPEYLTISRGPSNMPRVYIFKLNGKAVEVAEEDAAFFANHSHFK